MSRFKQPHAHTHTHLSKTQVKNTQTTDTLADLPEAPITHAAIELIVCCEHSLSLLKPGYILDNRRTLGFRNGVYALHTQSYSSTHHMLQTRAPCNNLRKKIKTHKENKKTQKTQAN